MRAKEVPAVKQLLHIKVLCEEENPIFFSTHGLTYNGIVTEVLPTPHIGVYVTYEDQQPVLSEEALAAERATLPALPPSFTFGCPCGDTHP